MTATTSVFTAIGQTIDNATNTFVVDVATATIDKIYYWALGGLTLYIGASCKRRTAWGVFCGGRQRRRVRAAISGMMRLPSQTS